MLKRLFTFWRTDIFHQNMREGNEALELHQHRGHLMTTTHHIHIFVAKNGGILEHHSLRLSRPFEERHKPIKVRPDLFHRGGLVQLPRM